MTDLEIFKIIKAHGSNMLGLKPLVGGWGVTDVYGKHLNSCNVVPDSHAHAIMDAVARVLWEVGDRGLVTGRKGVACVDGSATERPVAPTIRLAVATALKES